MDDDVGERPEPESPDRFDRDALKDSLWGQGVSDDLAEAWIARWEASAASRRTVRDESYWLRAADWIDRERRAS